MSISIFDIFKIGIGPSSSHTVGPMKAARAFLAGAHERGELEAAAAVSVELYGSLAATGKGHATDTAILLGLLGHEPDTVDPGRVPAYLAQVHESQRIALLGEREVTFDPGSDLEFRRGELLPRHTNGMAFALRDETGTELLREHWYSIGGGFIVHGDEGTPEDTDPPEPVPHPFTDAASLLAAAEKGGLDIAGLMLENEQAWRGREEVIAGLDRIWETMRGSIERGCRMDGVLPGRLEVPRRAPKLCRELERHEETSGLDVLDWVNAFAIAVNEENAAGGRVVTAPTNGAAGIIPAVLAYYERFVPGADCEGIHRFLLAAGAIGTLYKRNASISGAEMGCQGEVGVACSMAAGGLVAAQCGSNAQLENAAEIGMEHNLGLTCDPVGGLVQIPCIERNAMGAIKAINAARIALRGDGSHKVSLDQVIATMRQTGRDMQTIYKETSEGGLAVNVPEC